MTATLLARARESFNQVKSALSDVCFSQSNAEIILDQAEPGVHRIKLRLVENPAKPTLILVQEGKPSLAPDLDSGEPPEVEKSQRQFDAFGSETTFGWIDPNDLEPARTGGEIVAMVRALL